VSEPWVSIVIDNYNYGRFVAAAIESALAPSYAKAEVIVVDDGSTDESAEVIGRFAGRVTAIFQTNRGQSEAFHAGFKASRGAIILFLDADDALRPDAVEAIVAAWRPGTAKAQWCLASIDGAGIFLGNIFPNFPPGLTGDAIRRELLRTGLYLCPPTSGNAYAREVLDRILPLEPVRYSADGPINTVAPLYGETITIDRPLGYYRVHGGNDAAQAALAPEKFARYIAVDQGRMVYLKAHAARLGLVIDGDPLDRAVLHLQYRLASLKLLPEAHPVSGDTLAGVTAKAVAASLSAQDRLAARLAIAAWILLVALAPRRLAERLLTWRFVPASRSHALGRMLRRLGILRRTNPTAAPGELSLPERAERIQPA